MSEFKGITGPGRYRMRDGTEIYLSHADHKFSASGWDYQNPQGNLAWFRSGQKFRKGQSDKDIIAGPLTDESELAGLGGYAVVTSRKNGAFEVHGHGHPDGARGILDAFLARDDAASASLIDLATIRKDQLVKPEPKRETRKVWLHIWPDGRVDCLRDPGPAHPNAAALIEREITFTHGEGL